MFDYDAAVWICAIGGWEKLETFQRAWSQGMQVFFHHLIHLQPTIPTALSHDNEYITLVIVAEELSMLAYVKGVPATRNPRKGVLGVL